MKKAYFLISILALCFLFSCSPGNKFSTYSETEQTELYGELSERLDQYFIPTIKDNLLAFLFIMDDDNESLEDALLEKISVEMLDICEQWANDNNIDFRDWANKYAEDFGVFYVVHLIELAGRNN